MSDLRGTLKGYVDDAAAFQRYTLKVFSLNASQSFKRKLEIIIEPGSASTAQMNVIDQVKSYGASKGVEVQLVEMH